MSLTSAISLCCCKVLFKQVQDPLCPQGGLSALSTITHLLGLLGLNQILWIPLLVSDSSLLFFSSLVSRLSWLENSGVGFSLDYPTISLHAVSRDLSAYPREHLYVMVNAKFEGKECCLLLPCDPQ